jgi:hypothetical protein
MLAAGRLDSAVGWLLVCRELGLLSGDRPGSLCPRRAAARPRDGDRPAARWSRSLGQRDAYRDRDARLLPTLATKLVEVIGFAALALAVADEL